jgi:hypothetical protein
MHLRADPRWLATVIARAAGRAWGARLGSSPICGRACAAVAQSRDRCRRRARAVDVEPYEQNTARARTLRRRLPHRPTQQTSGNRIERLAVGPRVRALSPLPRTTNGFAERRWTALVVANSLAAAALAPAFTTCSTATRALQIGAPSPSEARLGSPQRSSAVEFAQCVFWKRVVGQILQRLSIDSSSGSPCTRRRPRRGRAGRWIMLVLPRLSVLNSTGGPNEPLRHSLASTAP